MEQRQHNSSTSSLARRGTEAKFFGPWVSTTTMNCLYGMTCVRASVLLLVTSPFGGQLTVPVYSALATRQWVYTDKAPVRIYFSFLAHLYEQDWSTVNRRATFSYQRSLMSVFQVHNETVNIWSHILGTVGFVYAMGALELYMRELDRYAKDELAVLIYFISVIACFFFSFVWVVLVSFPFSLIPPRNSDYADG